MKLPHFYDEQTASHPRRKTDVMFQLSPGSVHFTGAMNEAVCWIEREQLLDTALWALFVDQFHTASDDEDRGWRSEYWGKLMRGAVFVFEYTQNETLYALLERTVRDLLATQDALGRITSYRVANEFRGWDMWGRKYVLLGLQYFLDICANEALKTEIIAAMCRHADYILSKVGQGWGKTAITATSNFWGGMNSCSILEPFVRLYSITGDQNYLDFAAEIVQSGGAEEFDIFSAALEGTLFPFEYPVTKAYEMMSCFEGLLEYYRVTGIEKWKTAVVNFAARVMESDITLIGSAGCTHELFDHARVRQFDPRVTGIMQETCVTVTWMKLCAQLLCLTGEAKYADEIERSALNALLGSVNMNKNAAMGQVLPFDSYSPLLFDVRGKAVGGRKTIDGKRFYGCCAAIGAVGLGLSVLFAAMQSENGIYLNLYDSGTIAAQTPAGRPLALGIETDFPEGDIITVGIHVEKNERFTLSLRIPSWSRQANLSVNGKAYSVQSGEYAHITREWSNGDTLTLCLDTGVRVVHAIALAPQADDVCAGHFALVRGPVVLARDAAIEGDAIKTPLHIADDVQTLSACKPVTISNRFVWQAYEITLPSGECLHMVDYACAGQFWNKDRPITVWMQKQI